MNNLVVQLLLKTGTFSTDLKTARGQVQDFQKGCQTAGKSLTGFGQALGLNVGSLAKFGGAVGAAVLAGKELKNILDSSQTTSDSFQSSIAGCRGVIEQFRTSIATFDFSSFKNGLWDVFDAAKAVQEALDQLNNTQIAYDFKSKQNQTKFQEAYNVFKDPQSTAQMKEDAKKQMKEAVDAQFAFANNYSNSLYKTYVAQVVKKAGSANLNPNRVTLGQFEKAMNIDIGMNGDPEKARAENERQYREYLRKLKEYGKNNIVAQDNLKKQYADVIAIHSMLELMKDDELKGVAQLVGGMEDAKQVALSMQKTMNRAISGSDKSTGGGRHTTTTKVQKEELEIQKDSLTYWKNILSEETKYRDAVVKGTDEWDVHNEKVEEAQKKIDELTKKVDEVPTVIEGSAEYWDEFISLIESSKNKFAIGSEDYKGYDALLKAVKSERTFDELNSKIETFDITGIKTIADLREILNILKQLKEITPIDDEVFANWDPMIKKVEEKLAKVSGTEVKAPKTDTWNEFNQAMANTSTIVSSLTSTFKENSEVTAASILQMVSTALPAIGSLISSISALTAAEAVEAGVAATGKAVSTSKHWIEAIAAVAALGAAVAAALSAASKPNIQRFANGGIVGGSSFTGDRVSANVNSGEMILNRSQQARLFQMANGSPAGSKEVTFHISGTDLVGVMNNVNRKNKVIR